MSFSQAITSGFNNYANFSGRASRSAYWYWVLFVFLVDIVVQIVARVSTALGLILAVVVFLGLVVPNIAVAVRRLHDTDRSGWWILIGLVPLVGWIILIVFLVLEPTGPNKYGEVAPSV